ncbi:hypothetical protein [Streptomyces sp. NPDC096012]|uniref:hypothetical protein n=1 Tax=Streptomyces sp. NPDC096012 TaxID=3155684 RepID=UPI00336A478B
MDLDYNALEVPADPGLTIVTYTLAPAGRHVAAFARLRGRDSAERQTSVLIPGADRKVHRRLRRPCSPSHPVRARPDERPSRNHRGTTRRGRLWPYRAGAGHRRG